MSNNKFESLLELLINEEKQAGVQVDLDQGDMLIYMGCELEHWREAFEGKDCGQVFLH